MHPAVTLALAALAVAHPISNKQGDCLVSLGDRPYYIINNMTNGPLKDKLLSCQNKPVTITDFTIGHRGGGTLQFPEETKQAEDTGARMGADITIDEYSSLCGKQDGFNVFARTPHDYQSGTPNCCTELYDTCGKVLTLNEYIDLVDSYPGYRNFTPELKTPPPQVPMPFKGYTQQQYAQDFVDTFRKKNIDSSRIWPQSFLYEDIVYWLKNDHDFGRQAIYLQEFDTPEDLAAGMKNLSIAKAAGVNIIGPSIHMLVAPGGLNNKSIVPSAYANAIKQNGLDIIAWTYERSGPLATVKARDEYYSSTIANITYYDGQYYELLDVLANQIKIKGLFTEWADTVTYFANCFGLNCPLGWSYEWILVCFLW
ncbi:PLC-like phosphodiesterase [Paraphoma chrysanthemicola]|nr:PLC-like phosphodiesterase [Paraphoma chrysanthemicola]